MWFGEETTFQTAPNGEIEEDERNGRFSDRYREKAISHSNKYLPTFSNDLPYWNWGLS